MAKLLVEQNVRVYLYVMNTTIEAFKLPLWRKVPHDIEHYLLAGAPFMDVGKNKVSSIQIVTILPTSKLLKEGNVYVCQCAHHKPIQCL
jgi:hypothetical protein